MVGEEGAAGEEEMICEPGRREGAGGFLAVSAGGRAGTPGRASGEGDDGAAPSLDDSVSVAAAASAAGMGTGAAASLTGGSEEALASGAGVEVAASPPGCGSCSCRGVDGSGVEEAAGAATAAAGLTGVGGRTGSGLPGRARRGLAAVGGAGGCCRESDEEADEDDDKEVEEVVVVEDLSSMASRVEADDEVVPFGVGGAGRRSVAIAATLAAITPLSAHPKPTKGQNFCSCGISHGVGLLVNHRQAKGHKNAVVPWKSEDHTAGGGGQ